MMEQDAAPAGVPRKHALGRRRGSTRWPLRAARQELADGWSSTSRMTPAKRARPPEGETPRWRAERRPRSREGTRHDRTMVAPLGAPSPSISEGYGRGTTAYPAPQRNRAMTLGCLTIEYRDKWSIVRACNILSFMPGHDTASRVYPTCSSPILPNSGRPEFGGIHDEMPRAQYCQHC
jgi:hypothetical protein